jgi:hypothetical protein
VTRRSISGRETERRLSPNNSAAECNALPLAAGQSVRLAVEQSEPGRTAMAVYGALIGLASSLMGISGWVRWCWVPIRSGSWC